jgi:hypothetical protein
MRLYASRTRRLRLSLATLLSTLVLATLGLSSCEKRTLPPNTAPSPRAHLVGGTLVFSDDFERTDLGANWQTKHAGWTLKGGALNDTNAKNAGAWLAQPLPERVRVEFTARSEPLEGEKPFPGDLKCEIFATQPEHQAGYVLVNGGWSNRLDVIARLDEHGKDRLTRDSTRVEPSVAYRWAIVRVDDTVHWFRDGKLVLSFIDAAPVPGRYFGFNNWASNAFYDDLAIYALD